VPPPPPQREDTYIEEDVPILASTADCLRTDLWSTVTRHF
jgi:hypothetical protein